VTTTLVYVSADLSRVWHIAHRDNPIHTLCGQALITHGAVGWPRVVATAAEVYGAHPAVCRACSDARPLTPAEQITAGSRVRRADPGEPQHLGTVTRILPATHRLPAKAKVRWENSTHRFSGSTHTSSTVRLDRITLA
jgi:hypothetical protein